MDKVKKKNLDNRARDTIWSILNTYGTSIVSFFFVLVLTRLITPETFGLVAKFISIILVINVIVEAGRTTYLSRKKNILNKDLDYSIIWILIRSLIALILFNLFVIYFDFSEIENWKVFILSLILIFSAIDIVYNYSKWPVKTDKSFTFPYIKKGSNYLIKEFPNEKKYQDSKEKIEEL